MTEEQYLAAVSRLRREHQNWRLNFNHTWLIRFEVMKYLTFTACLMAEIMFVYGICSHEVGPVISGAISCVCLGGQSWAVQQEVNKCREEMFLAAMDADF